MANIRFTVKKGVKEALLATFDPTNLPDQSLDDVTVSWYVRKVLSGDVLIQKTSADPDQIEILEPKSKCQVYVYLQPVDTQNLHPGCYYWGFKLERDDDLLTISPPTSHGDLVLLDSAIVP
jgi:hypothetical protein